MVESFRVLLVLPLESTVAERTVCSSGGWSLWQFLGLLLILPGVEVLDGRELGPVMDWAVRTTLYNISRSGAMQVPYQVAMQPVKMLSMVQL